MTHSRPARHAPGLLTLALALILLMGLVPGAAMAQPANDLFQNRIDISTPPPPRTVTGSSVGATAEPGRPALLAITDRPTV